MLATLVCGTLLAQSAKMSGPFKGPMGAPMMSPDSPAAVVFTNFVVDPCTGFKYDPTNGFLLLGPNNCALPGSTQWLAYPFVSKASQPVTKVSLAVTDWGICVASSNKFTVAIYSDGCGGIPGTQIGSSVIATAPAAPPAVANANFGAAGVSLVAGQKYWVVATTSTASTQTGTNAVWWNATQSPTSFNLNDGNGWLSGQPGPGAFQVQ